MNLMDSFLRGIKPHLKNVAPSCNMQNQPVFPNGNPHLNRHFIAEFWNLVDPHLKITNRILAKFQNFHNS